MKTFKSLSPLLKNKSAFLLKGDDDGPYKKELEKLQLKMLRIQQGVFHKKDRVVIIFEGFDASGKGGAIRKITEKLDPRSVRVHPIGAPTKEEQGIHWLYRFWTRLPAPGHIAIFDRSWYGRVLVEKVDKLTPDKRTNASYEEINEFEKTLQRDGITIIKIFLAITKEEQLARFKDRLNDPYKQWKISMDDINARKKWNEYVKAVDIFLKKNNPPSCPWIVVPANSKKTARLIVLRTISKRLLKWNKWIEEAAAQYHTKRLKKIIDEL